MYQLTGFLCCSADVYLVHLLNEAAGHSVMVFCATCSSTLRTALLLRALGISAVPLHGQMTQNKRLAALNKFKARNRGVLLATDVASRYVIEYDLIIALLTLFCLEAWIFLTLIGLSIMTFLLILRYAVSLN